MADGAEEAVGLGEDVGFVGYGYFGLGVSFAAAGVVSGCGLRADVLASEGDITCHSCDSGGGEGGYAFCCVCDCDVAYAVGLFFFDVEVLRGDICVSIFGMAYLRKIGKGDAAV